MKFLSQLLKEYAMQSTSDYVFDTPSGSADTLKIPISSTMFKRVWPNTIRSTVFHATDLRGLERLKKIEGKKKSISAFWAMMARYMEKGVATEGGLVVEMEADVLVSARGDVMSEVDKQGRRWVEVSWFEQAQRYSVSADFSKIKKDLTTLIEKLVFKYITFEKSQTIQQTKYFAKESGDKFQIWSNMKHHLKGDGKTLRLVIKDYFDGVEKVLKKHRKILSRIFYGYANSKRSTDYSWDEQIVNNIKIKKVHVLEVRGYEDDEYVVHDDVKSVGNWPIVDWGSSVELEVYTRQVVKKEIGK